MARLVAILTGCALIALSAPPNSGIKPRPSPQDYPVYEQSSSATYAAAALSKEQVKNSFATNLSSGYIVLEIGVFPGNGSKVDLNRDDFLLRMGGSGDAIRPHRTLWRRSSSAKTRRGRVRLQT